MPSAPAKYCGFPLCGVKVRGTTYCPAHTRQRRQQQNTQHDHRLYRQARWRRFRQSVLMDRPFCQDCEALGQTRVAQELHHIVKRSDDLSRFYDESNVMPLCSEHHAARTRRGE